MVKLDTYDDLLTEVRRNGEFECSMLTLRELHGLKRLGKHVVEEISKKLENLGLRHNPEKLPLSQNETVKLFLLEKPIMSQRSDVPYVNLQRLVEESGGVYTVSMKDLKTEGVERLGKHVVKDISKDLKSQGLAHYPEKLPAYQDAQVRVYFSASPVAKLIEAVLNPGEEKDEIIRHATSRATEAEETLMKIKELVDFAN